MSTKTTNGKSRPPEEKAALPRELDALRAMLHDLAVAHTGREPENLLAVVRFFNGLEVEDWRDAAREYGLEQWLPVEISGQAAEVWEQWGRVMEEISFQRDHDVLTGLNNRRYFERELARQVTRAERGGADLSVAVIDLDRFKNINDSYGHAKGDEVLAFLGKLLASGKRPYDITARLGGEEFVLLLPDTSILQAQAIVERILAKFRKKAFKGNAKVSFTVTFSAGITSRWGKMRVAPEVLLDEADKAMYAAKAAGRNTIKLSSAPQDNLRVLESMVRAEEKKFLFGTF